MRWTPLLPWIAAPASLPVVRPFSAAASRSQPTFRRSLQSARSASDDDDDEPRTPFAEGPPDQTRFFGTRQPYRSRRFRSDDDAWKRFLHRLVDAEQNTGTVQDPVWEQTRLEALEALEHEPESGPQIYQNILSQPSLLEALVTVVSNEIETELIPATTLRNLCLDLLTAEDEETIRWDLQAAAMRSPSVGDLVNAMMFHLGLHALVCHRVGHRLWQQGRTGLAYYLQSTVSRHYSADIHPAATLGSAIYLCSSAGVVIGETAVCGDDVSILHGVTLGGTGKERGDRHPKVHNGVILQDGATVLGNIPVGDGAVVMAKSIVTKPVPPLAVVAGVPAKITSYRRLHPSAFTDDLEHHLVARYLDQWKQIHVDTVIP